MARGAPVTPADTPDVDYTDVDLNDASAHTVYNPSGPAIVYGVWLANGGGTADVQLQVTDGSDTVNLTATQGAGNDLRFTNTIALSSDDSLQINVDTAEGSAQTDTAAVSRVERDT